MRLILILFIIVLIFNFLNNKKYFRILRIKTLIVGDLAYEDMKLNKEKDTPSDNLVKFIGEGFLEAKKLNYSIGVEGEGVKEEVNIATFEVEKVKELFPNAVKKVGDKEVVDNAALVPILFQIIRNQNKTIEKIMVDSEKKVNNLQILDYFILL